MYTTKSGETINLGSEIAKGGEGSFTIFKMMTKTASKYIGIAR